MAKVENTRVNSQLAAVKHVLPTTVCCTACTFRKCQAKKSEALRSYLNRFTAESTYVRWALNVGVLAYLTNGVHLETPFWDELQQKKCRSISEFYRKENKFLKLKKSKEALHKVQRTSTSKKNDPGEMHESNKGKEKKERIGKAGEEPEEIVERAG